MPQGLVTRPEIERVAEGIPEPTQRTRKTRTAIREHGAEQKHDIGALGEADRLHVGDVVDLDLGGDGHTLPEVVLASGCHPQQCLRVGSDHVAELIGDPRQSALLLALHEELDRAEDTCRENHLLRGRRAAA